MGHNILALAKKNPNNIFIGIDPFINGVANLVHTCVEEKICNILLYPTPVEKFFQDFPKIICDQIYILFPDPWPKKKHHKRRLVKANFILAILDKLKSKGKIFFATDNQDYFEKVSIELKELISNKAPMKIIKKEPKYLENTKYFRRANKLGNKVQFLVIVKI